MKVGTAGCVVGGLVVAEGVPAVALFGDTDGAAAVADGVTTGAADVLGVTDTGLAAALDPVTAAMDDDVGGSWSRSNDEPLLAGFTPTAAVFLSEVAELDLWPMA